MEILYVKLERNTKRLVYDSLRKSKNCLPNDFSKLVVVQGGLAFSAAANLLFVVECFRVLIRKSLDFGKFEF